MSYPSRAAIDSLFQDKGDDNAQLEYLAELSHRMDKQRVDGHLCDLVIECSDGGEVFAHSNVLCSANTLIMLYIKNTGRREKGRIRFHIPDAQGLSTRVVDAVISSFYTNKPSLNIDIVQDVHSLARKLTMLGLQSVCLTYIRQHLTLSNVIPFLTWAAEEKLKYKPNSGSITKSEFQSANPDELYRDCFSLLAFRLQDFAREQIVQFAELPFTLFREILRDKRVVLRETSSQEYMLGNRYEREMRRLVDLWLASQFPDAISEEQVNQLIALCDARKRHRTYSTPCAVPYIPPSISRSFCNRNVPVVLDTTRHSFFSGSKPVNSIETWKQYPATNWSIKSMTFYICHDDREPFIIGFDVIYRNIWTHETGVHCFPFPGSHTYTQRTIMLDDDEWISSMGVGGMYNWYALILYTSKQRHITVLPFNSMALPIAGIVAPKLSRGSYLLGLQGFSYTTASVPSPLDRSNMNTQVSHLVFGFATLPGNCLVSDFGSIAPAASLMKWLANDEDMDKERLGTITLDSDSEDDVTASLRILNLDHTSIASGADGSDLFDSMITDRATMEEDRHFFGLDRHPQARSSEPVAKKKAVVVPPPNMVVSSEDESTDDSDYTDATDDDTDDDDDDDDRGQPGVAKTGATSKKVASTAKKHTCSHGHHVGPMVVKSSPCSHNAVKDIAAALAELVDEFRSLKQQVPVIARNHSIVAQSQISPVGQLSDTLERLEAQGNDIEEDLKHAVLLNQVLNMSAEEQGAVGGHDPERHRSLIAQVINLEAQEEDLEEAMSHVERQGDELDTHVSSLVSQGNRLDTELAQLTGLAGEDADIIRMREHQNQLQSNLSQLQRTGSGLQNQLLSLRNERADLRQQLEELREKGEEGNPLNAVMLKYKEQLEAELSSVRSSSIAVDSQLNKVRQEKELLRQQLEEACQSRATAPPPSTSRTIDSQLEAALQGGESLCQQLEDIRQSRPQRVAAVPDAPEIDLDRVDLDAFNLESSSSDDDTVQMMGSAQSFEAMLRTLPPDEVCQLREERRLAFLAEKAALQARLDRLKKRMNQLPNEKISQRNESDDDD